MNAELHFDGGFTSESWEYATAFAMSLGSLPTSVTSVVRLLLADFERDSSTISEYGRFFMSRFLKSKTLEVTYYYACKKFKPNDLPGPTEHFGGPELLHSFSGEEHAYLLSIIFFHRQAKKHCDPALFENATSMLQRGLNIGGSVGGNLPAVGLATGLLCGGLPFLAFFPFIRHDVDGFSKYARHLRANELPYDWGYEFERWQCNSLQVALMILQRAGLGVPRLSKVMTAIGTRSPILPEDPFERSCRAVNIWQKCLANHSRTPTIPLPPEFYLGPSERDSILESLTKPDDDRSSTWLTRNKNDISPERTPQLCVPRAPSDSADNSIPLDPMALPSELESALPSETMDSLSEKLLQDILTVEAD
jgi:hypothetical protein